MSEHQPGLIESVVLAMRESARKGDWDWFFVLGLWLAMFVAFVTAPIAFGVFMLVRGLS